MLMRLRRDGRHLGELLGRRVFLELLFPVGIRHAVDRFARGVVGDLADALLVGGGLVPFLQAVAAEARQVHQVDVLHIGALFEMRDQFAKGGGFELGAGAIVHRGLLNGNVGMIYELGV